jgi:hypothetical protein
MLDNPKSRKSAFGNYPQLKQIKRVKVAAITILSERTRRISSCQ